MEKYKGDNGSYPKNALELVPNYIDKIPIIINADENLDDEAKYNILKLDKLRGGVPWTADDGNYFEIKFYSEDDRTCLLGGRNNLCEYSSRNPSWNCHQ